MVGGDRRTRRLAADRNGKKPADERPLCRRRRKHRPRHRHVLAGRERSDGADIRRSAVADVGRARSLTATVAGCLSDERAMRVATEGAPMCRAPGGQRMIVRTRDGCRRTGRSRCIISRMLGISQHAPWRTARWLTSAATAPTRHLRCEDAHDRSVQTTRSRRSGLRQRLSRRVRPPRPAGSAVTVARHESSSTYTA